MPIYEYECTCCGSRFEVKRGFTESTPVSCPHCRGKAQHIFAPVPIIFKGSGFYVTDSRENHSQPSQDGSADKVKASVNDKK